MTVDVVVVGGGPAGLAAAGWLGRYRRSTLVVDRGEPRNRWVERVHGHLGSDPVPPGELLARGREDVGGYDHVRLSDGRAVGARRGEDGFVVEIEEDGRRREVACRRIVLATGVRDAFPDVRRFFEFYGADVFHCPTCDGYEARERPVAVFGWRRDVAGFAAELLDWASHVTIVTDGHPLEAEDEVRERLARHGVDVVEDRAVELIGRRGRLEGVELEGGGRVACSLAFFSIAHHPVNQLAVELGCEIDDDGHVVVDRLALTSVDGVYAAGDLTPGMQLVPIAAAEGTVAGVACALSLRGAPPLPGAPPPAPDPNEVLNGD